MKQLEMAIKAAIKGKNDKHYHLGAIAQRRDGSIVSSWNIKTRTPEPSGHAEARVLRKAGFGSTLWVARVMADGSWGLARPCKSCQELIKRYKVRVCYYTIAPNEYGVWRLK